MSNAKRWVQMGQGAFQKWETPGQEIEGVWRGTTDGKFGLLGSVDVPERGRVTFPLHTALLDCKSIRDGADIRIVFLGMKLSKGGKEFKAFQVFLASSDDRVEPAEDDSVPF